VITITVNRTPRRVDVEPDTWTDHGRGCGSEKCCQSNEIPKGGAEGMRAAKLPVRFTELTPTPFKDFWRDH
jgi:hypothetical protein